MYAKMLTMGCGKYLFMVNLIPQWLNNSFDLSNVSYVPDITQTDTPCCILSLFTAEESHTKKD